MAHKASGRGISAAVRNTMPQWLDDDTVDSITKALPNTTEYELRKYDDWVRENRRKDANGWTRTYRCDAIDDPNALKAEIRTNRADNQILYFAFKAKGKFVTGGDCRVASVFSSGAGSDQARVGKAAAATASKPGSTKVGGFRRLDKDEIARLNAASDLGDGFDRLFEERE